MGGEKKDLTGERFGLLTAIEPTPERIYDLALPLRLRR